MNNSGSNEELKVDSENAVKKSGTNDSTLHNDSISTDIDLDDVVDGSIDLKEITQSILDMEETQVPLAGCQTASEMPSSPPPSYEHVLAETRLEEEASASFGECSHRSSTESPPEEEGSPSREPQKGVQIMHKSHKEFYRAVAKQWGITCKMSDHCRCLDCQSMYFECEYDNNEMEKTDGGLGAGTPMFISEVMHGSACTILIVTSTR